MVKSARRRSTRRVAGDGPEPVPTRVASSELGPWHRKFAEHRYLVLQGLLVNPLLAVAHQYAVKRARFSREAPDDQVPGAASFYADPLMETILELALAPSRSFTGLNLDPAYSYLRVYPRGTILNPHTDRPACEITLSVNLGYVAPRPWPFFLSTPDGVQTIILEPGDGVLFHGRECPHWREELRGHHAAQLFLHYVDRDGPSAEWRYDKRPAIGHRDRALPRY